jgi:hypothetical protein
VTAHDVVRALRARGVAVEVHGERVRVAPADRVSAAELDALRTRKADVLALLRAETGVPAPRGPCGLCRSPLAYVEGWPTVGDGAWLCPRCAAWPAPSLAEVYATLTADERERLDAEAAAGDPLARLMLGFSDVGHARKGSNANQYPAGINPPNPPNPQPAPRQPDFFIDDDEGLLG